MSITQFHYRPERGKLTSQLKIPKGTVLYSRPVEGVPCKFRTCYDTTLWPIKILQAQWTTPDRISSSLAQLGSRGSCASRSSASRTFPSTSLTWRHSPFI